MTSSQWFIFFLIIQLVHGLGTWKLYIKANQQAWKAFIPVYNAIVLLKIINRPWWWIFLLFLPIVNIILLPVIWVETARSFGKNTTTDTFLEVITLGLYTFYLNYALDLKYIENRSLKPRNEAGEWTSSILFAVIAATIVHTYFIQPFVIPSSSLEKSLLVGDFLFVSKFHYGARVPMTTVGLPMVHDTIPGLKKKSYLFDDDFTKKETSWLNKLQLPYMRLPGFETIDRNEIVVFNQPADTLLDMNDFTPDRNYYKPIDKKTNLVKRCVGIPGDTLEVRDGYVYINGNKNQLPDRAKLQHQYTWEPIRPLTEDMLGQLTKKYEIENKTRFFTIPSKFWDNERVQKFLNEEIRYNTKRASLKEASRDSLTVEVVGYVADYETMNKLQMSVVRNKININLTAENAEKIKNLSYTKTIKQFSHKFRNPNVFPHDPEYSWNYDNFGPLYLPKEGATIEINIKNLPLYKRVITEYEGNTLQAKGNQIYINEELTTTYTFKQNYYWMMGDNRHNSIDARAWGVVPFDHVVGKPVLIWMSFDNFNKGIKNWEVRWDRLFTTVHGEGKAISFRYLVLLLIIGGYGYSKWKKRKSKA